MEIVVGILSIEVRRPADHSFINCDVDCDLLGLKRHGLAVLNDYRASQT
jgi:hypothetical protein